MDKRCHTKVINWPGRILASLLASFLSLPLLAAEAPIKPFHQKFLLSSSGFPFSIHADRTLEQDSDGNWTMRISADNWLGEVSEVTRFNWSDCIPQSSYYGYKRAGLGMERHARLDINQATGQAQVTRASSKRAYPVTATTTDKLSQTLALQCMLSRGDMALEVDVADERGLDHIRYRRVGEERLKTPAGRFDTVKLEVVREPGSKRKTLLWFARDHGYALVQMVQKEDGKTHTLVVKKL